MKAFSTLYRTLDGSKRTNQKIAALVAYFRDCPPADAAWAIHFLSGRRIKLGVRRADIKAWAAQEADIPQWLFDESYNAVGDLAETINLIVPSGKESLGHGLTWWIEERLMPLVGATPDQQRCLLVESWKQLDPSGRFLWNKLLTGAFRVGVSRGLITRAVSEALSAPMARVEERLMGPWVPGPGLLAQLGDAASAADPASPRPFFLASPLQDKITDLGPCNEWQAEWKWDGIRCQAVRRGRRAYLWSRGEELVTEQFPEIARQVERLCHDCIIDGEIVARRDGSILPFHELQKRLGRSVVPKRILREIPVALIAYDLLEQDGTDFRDLPLSQRRGHLEELVRPVAGDQIMISPIVEGDWSELEFQRSQAAQNFAEGLMLKRKTSPYRSGRVRGDWWKWKVDPYVIDAVLVQSRRGSGRRAGVFTDHTFAVWKNGVLVPVASAYSGLNDAEMKELNAIIKNSGLEQFGPVRTVKPEHVFELAFEGVSRSVRHRSGVALRFPRISRWRRDKVAAEADHFPALEAMITKIPVIKREITGELFPDWPGCGTDPTSQ